MMELIEGHTEEKPTSVLAAGNPWPPVTLLASLEWEKQQLKAQEVSEEALRSMGKRKLFEMGEVL